MAAEEVDSLVKNFPPNRRYASVDELVAAEMPHLLPRYLQFVNEQGRKDTRILDVFELYKNKIRWNTDRLEWGYFYGLPGLECWQPLGKDLRRAINKLIEARAWEHWGRIK